MKSLQWSFAAATLVFAGSAHASLYPLPLDGSAVVVDVRPASRVKPADAAKFAMTASACAAVPGWSFRLVHEPDPGDHLPRASA